MEGTFQAIGCFFGGVDIAAIIALAVQQASMSSLSIGSRVGWAVD